MPDAGMVQEFLAGAWVDAAMLTLPPGYRVLLLAVHGIARARAAR